MKKTLNKIILCFVAIIFIACLSPAKAFELNLFQRNNEGYFQKIHSDFPVYGNAVKLKDGRVLITGRPDNLIFDPKTNKFRKTAPFNKDIKPGEGILLNNGKILFIGAISEPPSWKFENEICKEMEKEKIFEGEEYRKYRKLSEEDKKKIYMPLLQKNPELMKKYNDYLELCENSMHAQLYNPKTENFESSGKTNFRRLEPKNVLLKDGVVFIIGGAVPRGSTIPMGVADPNAYNNASQIELYDPKTEKLMLVDISVRFGYINKVIALNDGRIFIVTGEKYTIYDPLNKAYLEPKKFDKCYGEILKLNDGRILFFSGQSSEFNTYKIENPPKELLAGPKSSAYIYTWQRYNMMWIKIYDPVKDEIFTAGHLAIPRGEARNYQATVLKDGRVLITGGQKDIEKRGLGEPVKDMNEAEIFNPKTGKSKLIKNMNNKNLGDKSILLDDGRVLFYWGDRIELYIPKGYKK